MEDKKHTPLPYKLFERGAYGDYEGDCRVMLSIEHGERIAVIFDDDNAELIVRACNSHYELLSLLKGFVEAADKNKVAWPIVIPAAAAIAKAEGK